MRVPYFLPLTLALSRQGREEARLPESFRRAKYFVGLKLALLLWLPALAASETSRAFSANFAFSAVDSSSSGASATPADHNKAPRCGGSNVHLRECSRSCSATVTVRHSLP